jgi:hypothetical protein
VVSLAVRATIVIDGVVAVTESVIVSLTVNSANLHSDSDAVLVPAFTNVIVVAVKLYGAVKNASFRLPLVALALPIVPWFLGNQSIDAAVVCIAHRRFSFRVTSPLNLASGRIPLVMSLADTVVAIAATSTYTVDSHRYILEVSTLRYNTPS